MRLGIGRGRERPTGLGLVAGVIDVEGVLVEVLNLIMDLGAMPTDDLGDFAVAHGHCVVELPSLRSPLERVGGENLAEEEREARRMGFGED
jgi:hypothetical protein